MEYVQVITTDGEVKKYDNATSVYKIRNLFIVEYVNENTNQVADSTSLDVIDKIFVGGRRVMKDKLEDRWSDYVFPSQED